MIGFLSFRSDYRAPGLAAVKATRCAGGLRPALTAVAARACMSASAPRRMSLCLTTENRFLFEIAQLLSTFDDLRMSKTTPATLVFRIRDIDVLRFAGYQESARGFDGFVLMTECIRQLLFLVPYLRVGHFKAHPMI